MSLLNGKLEGLGDRRGGDLPPLSSVTVPIVRTFSFKWLIGSVLFLALMGGIGRVYFFSNSATVPEVIVEPILPSTLTKTSSVPDSVSHIFSDFSAQADNQLKGTAKAWQSAITEKKAPSDSIVSDQQTLPSKVVLAVGDSTPKKKDAILNPSSNTSIKPSTIPFKKEQDDLPVKNNLVIKMQALTSTDLAKKAIKNAKIFLEKGDVINALSTFELALRYDPDNISIRQQLASLYYGRGDVWLAEKTLLAGLKSSGFQGELRWTLAKLWGQEKNQSKALSFLLPNDDNAPANYLMLRAQLAQRLAQYSLALSTYQQLTMRFPTLDSAWLGLAIESERMGGVLIAQKAYRRAMKGQHLSSQSVAFIQQRLRLLESVS